MFAHSHEMKTEAEKGIRNIEGAGERIEGDE